MEIEENNEVIGISVCSLVNHIPKGGQRANLLIGKVYEGLYVGSYNGLRVSGLAITDVLMELWRNEVVNS